MNIQEAKSEVINTIRAYTAKNQWGTYAIPSLRQRPILLIGPPGIGKTAIMEQAAAACSVGFVSYTMTHHTRQSAVGLPFIEHRTFEGREYAVTEYTMSEIIASVFHCIEESGCQEGLLFLDEINCVSETLAPTMLQFLQNKVFGSHRLPDGWILAAAGNPPEYNKSVREFDIATLDRLKYIEVEADYDAWRAYALEMNIHGAIVAYLDAHHDRFYILKQTYTSKAFATARGWEDLSCLLLQYEALDLPVTADLIGQYLHSKELAQDFAGFYQLFSARKKALPLTAMMQGDENAAAACQTVLAEASFDEKLYFIHLLLSALGTKFQDWNDIQHQITLFVGLKERLERFLKQQNLSVLTDSVMKAFLQKEQEILFIRKEHGLSSDRELNEMQRSLFELRTIFYEYQASMLDSSSIEDFLLFPQSFKENAAQKSLQLLAELENCLRLLETYDDAVFTLFLSSLNQNKNAQTFLCQYPSALWEQYHKRLEFQTRENCLRQKLLNESNQ